jgi:hypothetical protein
MCAGEGHQYEADDKKLESILRFHTFQAWLG